MNYLLISRYAVMALILVVCASLSIGSMLMLMLFKWPMRDERQKHWTWEQPKFPEDEWDN